MCLEAARLAVGRAPAALCRAVLVPARRRLAAIEERGIPDPHAVLVEAAQLRRIDLDEHAFRADDLRVELDCDASLALDEGGNGAHLPSPPGDAGADARAAG